MLEARGSPKYTALPKAMEELKKLMNIAFPAMSSSLMSYLKNMILVACMGRLGSLELAAGALAIGFTNITGYSVLSGLAMGMEPLCSQSFGSRNLRLVHLTLQRTILMLLFASIPIGFLWMNLKPLMIILHQDNEIASVAGLYCRFALPDLIAISFLHPIRIYMRCKGMNWTLMWSTFVAILIHVPLTLFLSFGLNLGVRGIAISTFTTNFNTLFFVLLYMLYVCHPSHHDNTFDEHPQKTPLLASNSNPIKPSSTSAFASNSNFEEWKMLIGLAIPSCLGVCLEWWWYEFMTISAGYLSNPRVALATAAIVIQTTSLMYTIPTALSTSVSTRVGNELGAGRPQTARLATIVAIGLALVSSMIGLLWITLGREAWGRVFSDDMEVQSLTMSILPIIGLCELGNCPQTTSCGVLRGSARPCIGVAINFTSFYLVGAPMAIVLAFTCRLGFVGLCYGLLAAQVTCAVSILIVIYRTDWERESLKAKCLVGKQAHGDQIIGNWCEEGTQFLKQANVKR